VPAKDCTQYCSGDVCNQAEAEVCNAWNLNVQTAVSEIQEAYLGCYPDGASLSIDGNTGNWSVSIPPTASEKQTCPNPWDPLACAGSVPAATMTPLFSTASGGTTNVGSTATTPVAPAQFSIIWSRAGSVFYPGDTWTVRVFNAAPGAAVGYSGTKNGAAVAQQLGVAASTGSFIASGTVGAGDVGAWTEIWKVGTASFPQAAFTIALPAAKSNSTGSGTVGGGTGQSNSDGSTGGGTGQSSSQVTPPATTFSLTADSLVSGLPNWAVLAVGALAVFFVVKK
jgi:hypothetical protein